MHNQNIIIGVAGGSGSGKTFFSNALHKKFGSQISTVIYQDNFYHDQSKNFDHDGGSVNFDHPESLDFDCLQTKLKKLKQNNEVEIPKYDFASHSRLSETKEIQPKKIIIVDGILILTQPELVDIFDLTIFVETPEHIRFQRRLNRDVLERGRTPEGVKVQFENQVKPMHDLFVEPSKENAQYISSGTDINLFNEFLSAIEMKIMQSNHIPLQKFSYGQFQNI
jgi:uridine kinase